MSPKTKPAGKAGAGKAAPGGGTGRGRGIGLVLGRVISSLEPLGRALAFPLVPCSPCVRAGCCSFGRRPRVAGSPCVRAGCGFQGCDGPLRSRWHPLPVRYSGRSAGFVQPLRSRWLLSPLRRLAIRHCSVSCRVEAAALERRARVEKGAQAGAGRQEDRPMTGLESDDDSLAPRRASSKGWALQSQLVRAASNYPADSTIERFRPYPQTRAQTLSTPCPVRCQSYIVTPRQIVQCRNQCMHSAVLAHGRHWCDGDHDHPRLIGPDESAQARGSAPGAQAPGVVFSSPPQVGLVARAAPTYIYIYIYIYINIYIYQLPRPARECSTHMACSTPTSTAHEDSRHSLAE